MATYDLTQTTPAKLKTGDIINVPYSGTYKTITLPKGIYKLEVWGAQGGSFNTTYVGGKGGYSYGTLTLKDEETVLHCYAGGKGTDGTTSGTFAGGWNGGGKAYSSSATYDMSAGGGGSDIRIGSTSLYARVIVAGGGGGAGSYSGSYRYSGGVGGGISGVAGGQYNTSYKAGLGGTQTTAGMSYYGTTGNSSTASYGTIASFGVGGAAGSSTYVAGGGGGWYGGGYARRASGGGGSGYVYTSSTASNYPSGCLLNSAYYLTDADTVAGNTSFVDYSGSTVTGHSGNGCIRITVVEIKEFKLRTKTQVKYTELSYIEGTGTQYIDTNFKPNQDTRVVLDIDITTQSSYPIALLGSRNSDTASNASFVIFIMTASQFRTDFGSATVNVDISTVGRFLIDKNKTVCTINEIAYTNTATTFQSNYTLSILTENDVGGYDNRITKGKIYSCQVYDNDVLIRDYVPAKDENGVVCLLDKVNNKFYYNVGTGDFVAGEVVGEKINETWKTGRECYVKTSNSCTPIPYIESTGTQYIDTEFKPNQDTRIVIDFEILNTNTTEAHISSARSSGGTPLITLYYSTASKIGTRYGMGSVQTIDSPSGAGRYLFDRNKNVLSINGSAVATATYTTFNVTSTLPIFARNEGSTINNYIKGKLYSCQIYDNGTLIRDFIPVLDASGVACLYDKVTKQCYYNQGTGEFLYVKPVNLPDGYIQKEYIESTGTQYIDTEITASGGVSFDIDFITHSQIATSDFGDIFGAVESGQYRLGTYPDTAGGGFFYNNTLINPSLVVDKRFKASLKNGVLDINGVTQSISSQTFSVGQNIYVFGGNHRGIANQLSKTKLYSFSLYIDNVLVRDFIPCTNPDGVIGLYDIVENRFYQNVGTGVFVVGDTINENIEDIFVVEKWEQAKEVYTKVSENLAVLSYIESTGTQYINTNYYLTSDNIRVSIDFEYTKEHVGLSLFGNHTSAPYSLVVYGAMPQFYVGSGSSGITCGKQTSLNTRYKLDTSASNGVLTAVWNGEISTATYSGNLYKDLPFYIFGSNANGILGESGNGYKLYGIQFYDNDTLVRDYIPVLDASGVACLYDKVTNQPFYNQGTGEFIAGYKTEFEPETELAFLESDGLSYIDTGFKPNQDTRVVMDAKFDSVSTTVQSAMFGSRNANTNQLWWYWRYNNSQFAFRYGSSSTNNLVANDVLTRHIFDANKNVFSVSDISVVAASATFESAYTAYIFAVNNAGDAEYPCSYKLYNCKIYDNDILIRDYIPKTDSTGVPTLFDKVTQTYFYNQGTGTFKTGTILKRAYWKQVI